MYTYIYVYACIYKGFIRMAYRMWSVVVQQWLAYDRKAKDSVGAQPTRLDVSADPFWCCRIPWELPVSSLCWNPDEGGFNTHCSNRINELACQCGGIRRQKAVSFFQVFLYGQRCDPGLGLVFHLQIIWLRKSPTGVPRSLGFKLIPDVVKLISHHNMLLRNEI